MGRDGFSATELSPALEELVPRAELGSTSLLAHDPSFAMTPEDAYR